MSLLSIPVSADSALRCTSYQGSFLSSSVPKEWLQSAGTIVFPCVKCPSKAHRAWAPVACINSLRPTLDDVERLSRGRASKAKIGSRAVPHRLNADERKAYELAKKRGFVVHQPNTRRYPLINSHRNYCDAMGIPCIRIDQGFGGQVDEVVMDLTPLRLSVVDVLSFEEVLVKAVEGVTSPNNQVQDPSVGRETHGTTETENSVDRRMVQSERGQPELMGVEAEASVATEETSGEFKPLRFQASSRSEAKLIAQTGLDMWKSWSRNNLQVVA